MTTREDIADRQAAAIMDHIEWARTTHGAISRADIARLVLDGMTEARAEHMRQQRQETLSGWLRTEVGPAWSPWPWPPAPVDAKRIPINCQDEPYADGDEALI